MRLTSGALDIRDVRIVREVLAEDLVEQGHVHVNAGVLRAEGHDLVRLDHALLVAVQLHNISFCRVLVNMEAERDILVVCVFSP